MTNKILPIGSVMRLKGGERKLMIIGRAPLYMHNDEEYYVDYCGCLYPDGQFTENMFFFNHEDIEEVYHMGYIDDMERFYEDNYAKEVKQSGKPKLKLSDVNGN